MSDYIHCRLNLGNGSLSNFRVSSNTNENQSRYSDDDGQRRYQDIARFDSPFCAVSLLPVIFLLNSYRKDKESWNRDKVDFKQRTDNNLSLRFISLQLLPFSESLPYSDLSRKSISLRWIGCILFRIKYEKRLVLHCSSILETHHFPVIGPSMLCWWLELHLICSCQCVCMITSQRTLIYQIIPLIQLINCFVKISDIIKRRVSYIWAIFLVCL